MKKINEMMISAYLKGMSKLNAFKDNESGEVNMVAIVLMYQCSHLQERSLTFQGSIPQT